MAYHRPLVVLPVAVLLAAGTAGCSGTPTPLQPAATGQPTAPVTEQPTETPTEQTTEQPDARATGGGSGDGTSRTARGELVDGFPTDVVPVPEGATITLSSLVRDGDVLAVSVAGETTASAEEVIGAARRRLREQGFDEAEAPQPDGGAAATFVRSDGAENISVTVLPEDGVSRFTVGGQLVTG